MRGPLAEPAGGANPRTDGRRRFLPALAVGAACGLPREAAACSVCLGDPNSPHMQGVNNAILFLLAVTLGVLAAFVCFFVCLWRRSRLHAAAGAGLDVLCLHGDAAGNNGQPRTIR